MNAISKDAVHAVCRLYRERTAKFDEFEHYDRHFDGGEWSGPAWGRTRERAWSECLNIVARHFHVDAIDLDEAIMAYGYEQDECLWRSMEEQA